jgi:hypothetical protein
MGFVVINFATVINLVFGLVVFVVIYLGSAPLIGAVNKVDIDNLRSMFSGLGIVSRFLAIPLRFMEKSLNMRNHGNGGPPDQKIDDLS